MPPTIRYKVLLITVAIVIAVGLFAFYRPTFAGILFLCLVLVAAVTVGRKHGFGRGFVVFIKEILFGW